MAATAISWTDYTFNPWVGCTKISAGCAHCYAETFAKNKMGLSVWGTEAPRHVTKTPWLEILKQNKLERQGVLGPGQPRLVFLGSLMDWAEDREDLIEPRRRMWDVVRQCDRLHFQMLTKRPENIGQFLPEDWGHGYSNVWLGTSIEDMRVAWRADELRRIPAIVRFISYEPALGPLNGLDLRGIDWVIYGGESGPGYRPEDKNWARSMRDKCREDGVAFFHKQSAAGRTESGVKLDGELVRNFPAKFLTLF